MMVLMVLTMMVMDISHNLVAMTVMIGMNIHTQALLKSMLKTWVILMPVCLTGTVMDTVMLMLLKA